MDQAAQIALMTEVQTDARAFDLLAAKLHTEGRTRHLTLGTVLAEFGDPRTWPEYQMPATEA